MPWELSGGTGRGTRKPGLWLPWQDVLLGRGCWDGGHQQGRLPSWQGYAWNPPSFGGTERTLAGIPPLSPPNSETLGV